MRLTALIALLVAPALAQAHTFGHLYTLPVPFWLYAWAATGALAMSFLASAYFLTGPADASPDRARSAAPLVSALRRARIPQALQALSVFMLLLTIASGLVGAQDSLRNFSMTAFWVVFLLGMTYACALAGNVYAWMNPWRVMTLALDRIAPGFGRGRIAMPESLDAWPALVFYLALIWIELGTRGTPALIGGALATYTVLNFAGVWLVGSADWFGRCEVFSVYFRNIARLAPVQGEGGRLHLGTPGSGALRDRPSRLAGVVFVLAMLASTAFDGLHETHRWHAVFWQDTFGVFTPLFGDLPLRVYMEAMPWFRAWDTLWLVAAPFVYLAFYALALWLARVVTGLRRSLLELMLDFAYTLLPIVLAYHLAHYFTLFIDQGPKILSLVSDPFGRGWDLFGTTDRFRAAYIPELTRVWHFQVGVILLGHVSSVVLAHRVALRVFVSRGPALLSQLPMLVLMTAFTVSGLWILSQPLVATVVRS